MTTLYVVLAAGVVALIVAPGPALAVLRVLGSVPLVLLAHAIERRRDRTRAAEVADSGRAPVRVTAWFAELVVITTGGRVVCLRSGMVRGPWTKRVEVERELLVRWRERYGWPPAGRLAVRAERRS